MIAYPDTSFLTSLYFHQAHTEKAALHFRTLSEPLLVTSLVRFEFRQGARLQVYFYSRNRSTGFTAAQAESALSNFDIDLSAGIIRMDACDWPAIFERADYLSLRHTATSGHRAFDILHVATALHLGAEEFLTFDVNQRRLAVAEGLTVPRSLR